MLFGEDQVWFGFEAESVVPGWIVVCAVVIVKKIHRKGTRSWSFIFLCLVSVCCSEDFIVGLLYVARGRSAA